MPQLRMFLSAIASFRAFLHVFLRHGGSPVVDGYNRLICPACGRVFFHYADRRV